MAWQKIQTALQLIYPPRCLCCGDLVAGDLGLCSACWGATPFIGGLVCDACGAPLPGDPQEEGVLCDDCMQQPRPWFQGRAALLYRDNGRKLVLALKHGDQQDIAFPAAKWMRTAAQPILQSDMLVTPVPLHWTRLLRRRFNQAALLAENFAALAGCDYCPDLLQRCRATKSTKGMDQQHRFDSLQQAIRPHPGRRAQLAGRNVLLIDDVMTTGATLSVSAEACLAGGAAHVSVLMLARVANGA